MNLKKTNLLLLSAVAAVSLPLGVVASDVVESITAQLRPDLQIVIDGQEQSFADANGQTVYPIMYNGTTYLPLRAIGGVMGKPVAWDEGTQTVTLGEKDAYRDLVAMPDKGDGYAGAKIIDATELTFPYGETKEDKTFRNGIRIENVNSADKTFALQLDQAYAAMNVTLHNPAASKNAVKMEIKDVKTDIVLLSKTIEPGQFFEAEAVNLNSADSLLFVAKGTAGNDDTVYFLEPQVH